MIMEVGQYYRSPMVPTGRGVNPIRNVWGTQGRRQGIKMGEGGGNHDVIDRRPAGGV